MKGGLLDAKAKVAVTRKDELGTGLFSDLFMFATALVKKVLVAGAGLFLFTAPVYWLVPVHRALTLRGLVGVAIVVACGILVSEIVLAWKRAKGSQPGPRKPGIEDRLIRSWNRHHHLKTRRRKHDAA
jgi:hypothetical protein